MFRIRIPTFGGILKSWIRPPKSWGVVDQVFGELDQIPDGSWNIHPGVPEKLGDPPQNPPKPQKFRMDFWNLGGPDPTFGQKFGFRPPKSRKVDPDLGILMNLGVDIPRKPRKLVKSWSLFGGPGKRKKSRKVGYSKRSALLGTCFYVGTPAKRIEL
jgi:hypothetical protein